MADEIISEKPERKKFSLTKIDLALIAIVILVLILSIYFRSTLLQYIGFYEPDGFYHFSVIRAAVANHFIVPKYLSISGWPHAKPIIEPVGLYWVTLFPYAILQYFGISFYTVMRLIPILFGILDMIGAFYLVRYLSKDKFLGLLAFLFVGFSMGDAARTSGGIYRGDGFVTIFLILALILLLEAFKSTGKKRVYLAIASGFVLSAGNLVWNGGPFTILTFLLIFAFGLIYYFLTKNKEKLFEVGHMLIVFATWIVFVFLFLYFGWIQPEALSGLSSIYLLIVMTIGWGIAYYIIKNLHSIHYFHNMYFRACLIILFAVLGFFVINAVDPGLVQNIFVNNGFTITNPFEATIQELQPPTPGFLYASFGVALLLTPMSIILYIASAFYNSGSAFWIILSFFVISYVATLILLLKYSRLKEGSRKKTALILLFILMLIILLTVFFFLNAGFVPFLITAAIFLVFYLSVALLPQASRYLQLFETPFWRITNIFLAFILASMLLFIAYSYLGSQATFWIIMTLFLIPYLFMDLTEGDGSILSEKARGRFRIDFPIIALMSYFMVTSYLQIYAVRFNSLVSIPLAIFAAFTIFWLLMLIPKEKKTWLYLGLGMVFLIVAYLAYTDSIYSTSITQADNINPTFIGALTWFNQNSAPNATVLTLWPDGSVIEGVANRTSVTDSVGSQNASKAYPFASWLFDSNPDSQFLISNVSGKPQYLLVRYSWLYETSGIFTEAQINGTLSNYYSYLPFDNLSGNSNSTQTNIIFRNSYNNIIVETTIKHYSNGTQGIESYATSGSGQQISPFSNVVFYDVRTGNYTLIHQTEFNTTNNQMFLLLYSDIPTANGSLNVTGGYLFNTGMMNSNLIKFLFMCDNSQCAWSSNQAKLQLVYVNLDTKIYRIIYNSTS